jgi:glycosyltransferase involved in cell wall biosynthesis
MGAKIICDVRQEHPSFQRWILEDESRRFGVRAVVTGSSYERKLLEEFELADMILVPSEHAKRTFLAAGIPAAMLAALPYGVDLGVFEPIEKRDSKFRVLYAGTLTLRKGAQYLLEAFRCFGDANAELVLAGPLDPDFKPVLARYEGRFRYAGVLPKLELASLYSSASVFVLPSLADSFSLGTLEAMACGLPVIVSENTGVAEFVEDGRQGFVVPVRDARAILEKLTYLRDNLIHTAEMGLSAAARARELTWSRYGQTAVNLHRHLSNAPAPIQLSGTCTCLKH